MSQPIDILGLYLHLATASQRRNRPHVRDRLLILAGVAAARMELPLVSDTCRRIVLEHNPRHLIRRWETLKDALHHADFLHLLRQLQRRYPLERAEKILASLGVDRANERNAYYSDEEYAAAILGETDKSLRTKLNAARSLGDDSSKP